MYVCHFGLHGIDLQIPQMCKTVKILNYEKVFNTHISYHNCRPAELNVITAILIVLPVLLDVY